MMKYIRLILVTIASLFLLTVLVEVVEFALVLITSGLTTEQLLENQETYFEFRNQLGILIFKPVYTFVSAYVVTYLGVGIVGNYRKIYYLILSVFQTLGIIYGAFFSDYKDSLATWYWFLLLFSILSGFGLSEKMKRMKKIEA